MPFDFSVAYERFQEQLAYFLAILPSLMIGILVFVLFAFIARGVRNLVQRASSPRHPRNLVLALGRLTRWSMLLVGLLIGVTIAFPTFTPANLISALGITGIAIGFAFRDILENFLAGILILFTEPFKLHDQIVYESYEGTVENIETRATTIVTYDGRRVVIPNAQLFKSSFTINTAFGKRRMEYDVTIGSGDNIARAKKIMLETLRKVEGVLPDPAPDVLVVAYADNGITIRMRWWVTPPRRADVLDVMDRVLESVKDALTSNGVDIPFPTQQVLFHDQTEEADGDRSRQREGWPVDQAGAPQARTIAGAIQATAKAQESRSPGGPGQPGS
jgi:small conductance mechanosensitive channel